MEDSKSKSATSLIEITVDVAKSIPALDITNPRTGQNLDLPRTKAASSSTGNMAFPSELKILNTNAVSEEGVDTAPRYSTKLTSAAPVHRPRQMSKSIEIPGSTDYQDQITPLRSASLHGGSPLVRSKSTFSIHTNVFTFAEPKMRAANSASSFELMKDVKEISNGSNTISEPSKLDIKDVTETTIDDGFLRDIELKGFAGIWGHPVTRMYFLMYLIWKGYENLYILRMEIVDYRNNFSRLSASYRSTTAKRIKKLYLSPNSAYPVQWPSDIANPTIEEVLDKLSIAMDSPDVTAYDDVGYLALQSLEKAYLGTFTTADSAEQSESLQFHNFRTSPFYQAMINDLIGTTQITSSQYKRGAERVIEMCNTITMDMGAYENIMVILEDLSLDNDFIRQGQKKKQKQIANSMSTTNVSGEDAANSTGPSKSARPQYATPSIVNHAFLPSKSQAAGGFCEYCFEMGGVEEAKSLYSCETCGFISHKNCRYYVSISCVKSSADEERNDGEGSEKIRLIQEKIVALQREVDIELKIQEGLEKIVKAKKIGRSKQKTAMEKDIILQLEKNNKRLEVLKHEMQKRKVQLQTAQLSVNTTPATNGQPKKSPMSKLAHGLENKISNSNTDTSMLDTGILRVVVVDPITKAEFKKAIYITENQSTVEVIEMILTKSNVAGTPNEYELSFKTPEGEHVILKDEDRPTQIEDINYADTLFYLNARAAAKPMLKDKDDPLLKKQMEILTEIIDSELKYLEDLKLIQVGFMDPVQQAGCLTEEETKDVFYNIRELISVHEVVWSEISASQGTFKQKLLNLIDSFMAAVQRFSCYQEYCGNQYQQRAVLKLKRSENMNFSKILLKCEANPKLHKLNLADMLMKPMQKITRYPLLFKRLLPNLVTDSLEYHQLTDLISEMEKAVCDVNETVRKMEARFRIKLIGETMDFGIITDKFKIERDDRDLLQENTIQYLSKTAPPTEVIVFLFSDMILITRRSKKIDGGYMLFKPPIPMESVVFIDSHGSDGKPAFQIAHQKQEIHTLQTYSVFDKNSWLQEAESARSRYVSMCYDLELAFMRIQLSKYRAAVSGAATPQRSADESSSQSVIGSFFFGSRKNTDENLPLGGRKVSKRLSVFPLQSNANLEAVKPSPQDLLVAKTRLSKASRTSVLKPELPAKDQITPAELQKGKIRLSVSPASIKPGDLRKQGSLQNMRSSSSNLLDKFKKTFKQSHMKESL